MTGASRDTRALLAMAALAALAVALLAASPAAADAQGNRRTRLDISGFPLTVTGTQPTDFDAGSVALGSTSFSVDLTTNAGAGGFSPRRTTVQVRCAPPCPATGTLPLGGLQWRRADLGTWNTLTTTFVTIETRDAFFNGSNDPWSNSVAWRYQLTWTGTPPTPASAFYIEFQLVVTAP